MWDDIPDIGQNHGIVPPRSEGGNKMPKVTIKKRMGQMAFIMQH
ncbi:hypothetical protein [Lacrimispora brassicae]